MPTAFVSNLSDNTRKEMIALLNERLADAIDLTLGIKQAHWNIKGSSFIGIHELLDGRTACARTPTRSPSAA